MTVSGPASLAGLGSAHPAPPGPYTDAHDVTWQGRAMAIVRAAGETGTVTLTVTSPGLRSASATLSVEPSALVESASRIVNA